MQRRAVLGGERRVHLVQAHGVAGDTGQQAAHDARIGEVEHVFDVYMSPGSVTEKLYFFAAPYDANTRETAGGGLAEEGEEIGVLELGIDEALAMIGTTMKKNVL